MPQSWPVRKKVFDVNQFVAVSVAAVHNVNQNAQKVYVRVRRDVPCWLRAATFRTSPALPFAWLTQIANALEALQPLLFVVSL